MSKRMKIIYHIVEKESWEAQKNEKEYIHASLAQEGFIHASEAHQVEGVLQRYYKEKRGLYNLHINTALLQNILKYEVATAGEEFPHIYGAINKDSIIKIEEIS